MNKQKAMNPVKTTDWAGLGLANNHRTKVTIKEQSWSLPNDEAARKLVANLAKAGVVFITVEKV